MAGSILNIASPFCCLLSSLHPTSTLLSLIEVFLDWEVDQFSMNLLEDHTMPADFTSVYFSNSQSADNVYESCIGEVCGWGDISQGWF